MTILYLHQYYRHPNEGGAIRSYYNTQALAAAGHRVIVVTAWDQPHAAVQRHGLVEVHYLPVPYGNHMPFWRRLWAFGAYNRKARRHCRALMANVDLVFATSTPLTVGRTALWAQRRYDTPFVLELRDWWPQVPIALGLLRNPLLRYMARSLERRLYATAAAVVALAPPVAEAIAGQLGQGTQLKVIPNMADTDFFTPSKEKPVRLLRWMDLDSEFVVAYTGTLGLANAVGFLLDAAAACQRHKLPVRFYIMGQGKEKNALENRCQQEGLTNVRWLRPGGKAKVRNLLAVADAVYVSFIDHPIMQHSSPNKLFDGLAAGRLVITNTVGWFTEAVETAGAGFYAHPHKPNEFVASLRPYVEYTGLLEKAQRRARKLAEERFGKEKATSTLVALLESQFLAC